MGSQDFVLVGKVLDLGSQEFESFEFARVF